MKIKQVLIAFDQLMNTFFWIRNDGFGFADETLSARAWRLREQSRAYKIIDAIFFWDKDHCYESYKSEKERNQLPDEYRKMIAEKRKLEK